MATTFVGAQAEYQAVIDAADLSCNGIVSPDGCGQIYSLWDHFFLFYGGVLVFFMQAGFAMLTAGNIRSKNVMNVLLKNLLDACAGAITWWLFGYPFAYGDLGDDTQDDFIATKGFAQTGTGFNTSDYNTSSVLFADWFFQWAFAATAATIVCGGVAERCTFKGYLIYSTILTGFIYPVVVHWTWGGGWLSQEGYTDFAGSGIVHMVGGFAALMGAIVVGPRTGRFLPDGSAVDIPGHNAALSFLGTFILWFGWYGFNPVSSLSISGGGIYVAGHAAVITTLGAGAGGVTAFFGNFFATGVYDTNMALNGVLGGLVSITAGPDAFKPYMAVIVGSLGGLVYMGSSKLVKMMKVDDPLDAFAVHGCCGAWGVFATGLFAFETGLFYGETDVMEANVIGILAIAAWTTVTGLAMFLGINATVGLRTSAEEEEAGLDNSKHGGSAYPELAEKLA